MASLREINLKMHPFPNSCWNSDTFHFLSMSLPLLVSSVDKIWGQLLFFIFLIDGKVKTFSFVLQKLQSYSCLNFPIKVSSIERDVNWDCLAFVQDVQQPGPRAFILTALVFVPGSREQAYVQLWGLPYWFSSGKMMFFLLNSDRYGLQW